MLALGPGAGLIARAEYLWPCRGNRAVAAALGPEAVLSFPWTRRRGQDLLLSAVLPEFPDILYSRNNPTPQALFRGLAELLLAERHPVFAKACPNGPASLQAKSAISVKGLLRDALLNSSYLVVLDHLMRPSQPLAASIRELMLNWSVPVDRRVTFSPHGGRGVCICRYSPTER